MPRSHPPYPDEFRARAVQLVRSSDEPISKIADELGISHQTLRNWVHQSDGDAGRRLRSALDFVSALPPK